MVGEGFDVGHPVGGMRFPQTLQPFRARAGVRGRPCNKRNQFRDRVVYRAADGTRRAIDLLKRR